MEMFQAFGMRERVEREAYWVNETAFWKPNGERPGEIMRSGLIQDVEDGLAPYPHVIINQARVHRFLLDIMARSAQSPRAQLQPPFRSVGGRRGPCHGARRTARFGA